MTRQSPSVVCLLPSPDRTVFSLSLDDDGGGFVVLVMVGRAGRLVLVVCIVGSDDNQYYVSHYIDAVVNDMKSGLSDTVTRLRPLPSRKRSRCCCEFCGKEYSGIVDIFG
jgi:hypothetical protein